MFAPQSGEGWSSACACVSEDAEFAFFVTKNSSFDISTARVDLDAQIPETIVAQGFLANIPVGSTLQVIEERASFMQKTCSRPQRNLYQCDYWLQFNKTSERGYSLLFHLSNTNQLQSVNAKKIIRAKANG